MTRPLNSKFTISADRPAFVYYTFDVSLGLLLPSANIQLAIYDELDNETIIARKSFVYLAGLGSQDIQLSGFVPAGYEVQIKKSGSASVSIDYEQEVIG